MHLPTSFCWFSLLLGGLLTCRSHMNTTNPPLTDQTLQAQTADATLLVHFMPTSDTMMTIQYRLTNRANRPLYVFNKLQQGFSQNKLVTSKDFVYVSLTNERALVMKAIYPRLPGVNATVEVFPCVTKIPPHSHIDETITVSFPLSEQTPYGSRKGLSKRVVYKPFFFGLGYFVGTEFTEAQEKQVETTEGPAIHFDTFNYQHQQWITVGPLAAPVMAFEVR